MLYVFSVWDKLNWVFFELRYFIGGWIIGGLILDLDFYCIGVLVRIGNIIFCVVIIREVFIR